MTLDNATAELLAASLRELLDPATDTHGLAKSLDELGWADVLDADPATATTLLFTEHGRALANSRALDDVLLAELEPLLPETGAVRALLYPHPADAATPAPLDGALHGLLLGPVDSGVDEVVIPASTENGVVLRTLDAATLTRLATPVSGFDSASRWYTVAGVVRRGPEERTTRAEQAWPRAVAAAYRALAAELLGSCEEVLRTVVDHTSGRVQYGRPIASFQVVRHRLAESSVAVAGVRSVLDAAWTAAGEPDGGLWSASLAKLQAGRAQADVMRHAVQVSGAMGLSAEGQVHRFVTRAAALDALLGGRLALGGSMGAELLAGAELDPVVEL